VDRLRQVLSSGALEGRTFTASAVPLAEQPERDHDELGDELDATVAVSEERPEGLVREAG